MRVIARDEGGNIVGSEHEVVRKSRRWCYVWPCDEPLVGVEGHFIKCHDDSELSEGVKFSREVRFAL